MIPEPALSNSPISDFGISGGSASSLDCEAPGENDAVAAQDRDRVGGARHRGSPKPHDVVSGNCHLRHAVEASIPLQSPVERKQVLSRYGIKIGVADAARGRAALQRKEAGLVARRQWLIGDRR